MANSYKDRDRWAAKNGKGGKIPRRNHGLDDEDEDFDPRRALESIEKEEKEEEDEKFETALLGDANDLEDDKVIKNVVKKINEESVVIEIPIPKEILKPIEKTIKVEKAEEVAPKIDPAQKMQDDWNRLFGKKGK